MTGPVDEFWAELRAVAARADPVPPHVVQAALASLSWRDPDAALAQLVADTLVTGTPAGVRGGGAPRLLTFATDEVTIEVEAGPTEHGLRLVGQIVPPGPATVRVDHRGGSTTAEADHLGRFMVDGIAPGPVRLTCAPASNDGDAAPTRTSWTLL